MNNLQKKLEKSIGKRLIVELYNLTPNEQKKYLMDKTYIQNGKTYKYAKSAIKKRVCMMSKLEKLGLMPDVMFDIYYRSKGVDDIVRAKAKDYYDKLRRKLKKSIIKKTNQKIERFLKRLFLIKNR